VEAVHLDVRLDLFISGVADYSRSRWELERSFGPEGVSGGDPRSSVELVVGCHVAEASEAVVIDWPVELGHEVVGSESEGELSVVSVLVVRVAVDERVRVLEVVVDDAVGTDSGEAVDVLVLAEVIGFPCTSHLEGKGSHEGVSNPPRKIGRVEGRGSSEEMDVVLMIPVDYI